MTEAGRPLPFDGSALMLPEGEIDDQGIHSSIMRGWRFRGIARGSNILNFRKQSGNLPLQSVDLAPLGRDCVVQFGDCLVLVRDQRLQRVEARKI